MHTHMCACVLSQSEQANSKASQQRRGPDVQRVSKDELFQLPVAGMRMRAACVDTPLPCGSWLRRNTSRRGHMPTKTPGRERGSRLRRPPPPPPALASSSSLNRNWLYTTTTTPWPCRVSAPPPTLGDTAFKFALITPRPGSRVGTAVVRAVLRHKFALV